jgi:hypothetical protein
MRLLKLESDGQLRLSTFSHENTPPYAILSHTWGGVEVLFEDIRNGTAISKGGYAKIKNCCDLALEHGFEYVWVDTCCIDKSSSSELQEAICSMYSWYKNANICYAYLEDFEQGKAGSLARCKWFTRGWTLRKYTFS